MKYYTKFLLGGVCYIAGVSYVLRDAPQQFYERKNQQIENLRAEIYQVKVNILILFIKIF